MLLALLPERLVNFQWCGFISLELEMVRRIVIFADNVICVF